jgi:hypothetical protein
LTEVARILKGLHWGISTWWDWKYFFHMNVPFDEGLDHKSLCKPSDHLRTSFFQNNNSYCKKMTQNEKRLNAFHSNRTEKHKNTFNLFQSIFLYYLCIYFCLKCPSSFNYFKKNQMLCFWAFKPQWSSFNVFPHTVSRTLAFAWSWTVSFHYI